MAATENPAVPATDNAKPAKAPGVMMPLLAVFVLMPALAYGLTEYIVIPKLRATLPAPTVPGEPGAVPTKKAEAKAEVQAAPKKAEGESKKGGESVEASFEFKDVIVNLSGALGTRYLKTSFTVTGSDARVSDTVKNSRQKLLDIAIGVLSSRTLNDLDNPAGKNVVREELIAKFNHALGVEMIEEIYFSEFVIQ